MTERPAFASHVTLETPAPRDDAWFPREVLPKLDDLSLSDIAAATGFSLTACSRIRSGSRVPHQRHWSALALLVETSDR